MYGYSVIISMTLTSYIAIAIAISRNEVAS